VRLVRHDDGPRIRRAFRLLAPETIYMRFFAARHELSDAEVERATHPDNARDVALLVTIGDGTDETLIAGASCLAIGRDNPPRAAEVAFTVEEDYQGRGIASLLLQHLAGIAQKRGLERLEADVLAGNTPMLAVFRKSRLPGTLRHDGDIVHVTLSLTPSSDRPQPS
jgi:GNAT superfamily N-acetyltransferase